MPFLTLNNTTIRVKSNAAGQKDNEHGLDRERMFDGAMRMTRRGIFREWQITTALLTDEEWASYRALINTNSGLLTAGGDLIGADCTVMPVPGSSDPVHVGGGEFKRRMTFVLHEQGGLPPADSTASVHAFWRGGVGYKTGAWTNSLLNVATADDLEVLAAAGDGDPVSAWLDQSGNQRHWMGGVDNFSFNTHGDSVSPLRQGSQLRFGTSAPTNCRILQTTEVHDWWSTLARVEIMAAFRPTDPTPIADGKNAPWAWQRSGGGSDGNALYPAADGHLYETACTNSQHDLGVSTVDFSSMQVVSITVDTLATSPNWIVRIGNTVIYETTEVGVAFPYFDGHVDLFLGIGQTSGYWDGIIKHVLVADPMTTAQRASWYDFMRGAAADPPLPE